MSWLPQTMVTLEGDNLAKFQRMLDVLEDNDDVQNVFHNMREEDIDE